MIKYDWFKTKPFRLFLIYLLNIFIFYYGYGFILNPYYKIYTNIGI